MPRLYVIGRPFHITEVLVRRLLPSYYPTKMPLVEPWRNATSSPLGASRAVLLKFLAQELLAVAASSRSASACQCIPHAPALEGTGMIIHLGYEFIFEAPAPTPMLLLLSTHPTRAASHMQPDRLCVEPEVRRDDFVDRFGNNCTRIVAPTGRVRLWNDTLVKDSGEPDPVRPDAVEHAIEDLPLDALPYLLASR